jgi:hypothetical protein
MPGMTHRDQVPVKDVDQKAPPGQRKMFANKPLQLARTIADLRSRIRIATRHRYDAGEFEQARPEQIHHALMRYWRRRPGGSAVAAV